VRDEVIALRIKLVVSLAHDADGNQLAVDEIRKFRIQKKPHL
jgi:hypothetical protein